MAALHFRQSRMRCTSWWRAQLQLSSRHLLTCMSERWTAVLRMQISRFCAAPSWRRESQVAAQIGGYRTATAASDCDAVLQPIPSVSDLIADSVRVRFVPSRWPTAP